MSAPCFTNCTNPDLIGLPIPNCGSKLRRTIPARIFMRNCDIALPTGAGINAAMKTLFDTGKIVSTSLLANVVFEDPTFQELVLNDCEPATSLVDTRAITFEDRTAYDGTGASPYVINTDADYDFWADKLLHQHNIRFMLAYCNGDVKDIAFVGTLRAFIDYLKPQTAGGLSTEIKKCRLLFNGDPINFSSKVIFNYIDAGIIL